MRAFLYLGALPLIACGASRRPPIAWEPPIELAAGGGERGPWQQNDSRFDHVDDATVAFDARGAAVAAWVDHRAKDVFVQTIEPGGARRPARPVTVSRTPAVFSWLPRVVVAGSDVYVLWQEIIFSGGSHGGDILFARSLDGGAVFEPPRNLSTSIPGDGKGRVDAKTWDNGSLDLAVGPDGTLHATWTEYEGTLWLTRSRDRGATFAPPRAITIDRERPARGPALAVAADALYLAWTTGEDAAADIHLAVSTDGGATFAPPVIVARTAGYSDAPKLALDAAGTLHLVFCDSADGPFGRYDVYYTRSRDRGAHFDPPRVLSPPGPGAAYPQLALASDRVVHVVWEHYPDRRPPPRGLAIATSRDGGDHFTAPALIPGTTDPGGGGNGSFQGRLARKLAVHGDAIAIANASLAIGRASRAWLVRGRVR